MREPTTVLRPATLSRAFPASAAHIQEARRCLALLLDGSPAADDAAVCLSELATNAVIHSRSRDGGHFTVTIYAADHHLRVEVRDQGGPWESRPEPDERRGRGLLIVSKLADSWGRDGDSTSGWTVWFDMDLP